MYFWKKRYHVGTTAMHETTKNAASAWVLILQKKSIGTILNIPYRCASIFWWFWNHYESFYFLPLNYKDFGKTQTFFTVHCLFFHLSFIFFTLELLMFASNLLGICHVLVQMDSTVKMARPGECKFIHWLCLSSEQWGILAQILLAASPYVCCISHP